MDDTEIINLIYCEITMIYLESHILFHLKYFEYVINSFYLLVNLMFLA